MKLEPYRILFPIGIAYALIGALVWPLHAAGRMPYPGPLHRALMIQGFELSFVLGFLLTALPGFLHAGRATSFEIAAATTLTLGFGACALAYQMAAAQGCFVLAVGLLAIVALQRFARASRPPAMELMFVVVGITLGLAGGITSLADAAGWRAEPLPGFGLRMVSLGMVLSMVMGVGGLLVPTFTGVRDPLLIAGIAAPHEAAGRRLFYGLVAALFLLAFGLESRGARTAGAWVRALAATPVFLMVWKLARPPARRDLFTTVLRGAGFCALAGLWLAALLPRWWLAAYHVLFVGGFGLLTLGIATRVVVAHGGHPHELERRLLGPWAAGGVALALIARVAGELLPASYFALLTLSALLWSGGWLAWAWRALPLIAAPRRAAVAAAPPDGSR